jgi:hypothetical protein
VICGYINVCIGIVKYLEILLGQVAGCVILVPVVAYIVSSWKDYQILDGECGD